MSVILCKVGTLDLVEKSGQVFSWADFIARHLDEGPAPMVHSACVFSQKDI